MPLNIKNAEVERLATEVSGMTGESKTEAIRTALLERRARLALAGPADQRGRRLSPEEEAAILGYGPDGV